MTFLHFVDCFLLGFAPSYIIFKASKLDQQPRAYTLLIKSSVAYLSIQLIKFLLIATFVSATENNAYSLLEELMKAFVGCTEIIAVQIFLKRFCFGINNQRQRVLAIALGWATTENITARLIPLGFHIFHTQFEWSYILGAIRSNLSILFAIGFVSASIEWSKPAGVLRHEITLFLFLCILPLQQVLYSFLSHVLGLGEWEVLLANAAVSLFMYFGSRLFVTDSKDKRN